MVGELAKLILQFIGSKMDKKNLSKNLTVFVIATEKSKNYKTCLDALARQTVDFRLDEIIDYYPMSEAYNK